VEGSVKGAGSLLEGQSDEALMGRVAHGGQDAFEVLLSRYEDAVITFCYAFVRDRQAAEDLAQETFLRVYRSAGRYRPLAKFTTWLYRIAANLCINELKRSRLRRAVSLDEPAGPDPDGTRIVERVASDARQPLSEAETREAHALVEQAIERLPEEQRTTLVMVEYHNLSYREIADVLGVTVSAIKMRVKRARETLREMLSLFGADREGAEGQ
jgi:RNA polymerase sigma-70 factor (ECF subfamily)